MNKFSEAEALCRSGLEYIPNSLLIRRALADNKFALEKYEEAYSIYAYLINFGDSTNTMYKKYGLCAYNLKMYAAAMYALQKAISMDDEDPLSYYYLGLTFKHVNNHEKAILYLNMARTLFVPDDVQDVFIHLGDAYDQNGDYVQALSVYKQVNAIYPEWPLPYFYIATIYDKYYADREPSLEYYKLYIEKTADTENRYLDYAKNRVEKLIEELHFKKQ
jgi:tetratricopeptide (TPR) repeat protein